MVKIFYRILCLAVCLFLLLVPAAAASARVFDDAAILTADEAGALEEAIASLPESFPLDIVVHTTNSTNGQVLRDYADDYFDYGGFGKGEDYSGAILVIDMGEREVAISTCGKGILYLTDDRIDRLLDAVVDGLADSDPYKAALAYINGVKGYVNQGIPDNQYQYDEETGEITRHYALSPGEAAASVGVAAAVGLICVLSVFAVYNKKPAQNYSYNYRANSRLTLTQQEDRLVNQFVTTRVIPTPPPSSGGGFHSSGGGGGRSTTHHSSSGRSHGGGSRKF